MLQIILHHNLIPIPIDIQPDGGVSIEDVVAKITSKTRGVLIAHLFGNRIQHFAEICKAVRRATRGGRITIFEDCAEAFVGLQYTGCPQADVSMFSFGMIKTATAFGGGILTIRDPELLPQVKWIQGCYAKQSESAFLGKMLKCLLFKALTDSIYVYGLFLAILGWLGVDHHAFIRKVSRSFSPETLMVNIHTQPSSLLLHLLLHRLRTFDPRSLEVRKKRVEEMASRLPVQNRPLGFEQREHVYWLCPIRVKDSVGFSKWMFERGWDCADGGTSLAVVCGGGGGADGMELVRARRIMGSVVYLPVDTVMSPSEAERCLRAVKGFLERDR